VFVERHGSQDVEARNQVAVVVVVAVKKRVVAVPSENRTERHMNISFFARAGVSQNTPQDKTRTLIFAS
jgi:hypothetical protein